MLEQYEFQSPDYDHLYKNVGWINYLLQGFLHVTLETLQEMLFMLL